MEKKTKKILLISAGILLIGGGIGYWLWRRNQTPKEESNVPLATDDSGTPAKNSTGTTTTASGPTDVKAFQDWMDKNHPNWVKGKNLNKGSGYGSYGPSTQAAWNTYKGEFQKPIGNMGVTPKPPAQTTLISKGQNVYPVLKDIALFQYPAGNSLMGKVISNDLTKPIGVFDSYSEGFAKVWMNKSGVSSSGGVIKAPYWTYVYKSMVKK
jgi:hypothetical protein